MKTAKLHKRIQKTSVNMFIPFYFRESNID